MAHRRPSMLTRLWHAVTGTAPEERHRRAYWPYNVQTQRAREERAKLTEARRVAAAEKAAHQKRAREIAAETMRATKASRADVVTVKRIAEKERKAHERAAVADRKAMAKEAADNVLLELRAEKEAAKAAVVAAKREKRRVPAAVARAAAGDDIAEKVARGEIKGTALRELMASGALALKRNPAALKLLARLRPSGRKELARALTVAREFHGEGQTAAVVELSEKERARPPRFAVVIGELESLAYVPPGDSERAGAVWEHRSGDRGPFGPASDKRPILAADPKTKRPFIVQDGSPMRLDSDVGLVG